MGCCSPSGLRAGISSSLMEAIDDGVRLSRASGVDGQLSESDSSNCCSWGRGDVVGDVLVALCEEHSCSSHLRLQGGFLAFNSSKK